MTVKGWLAFVRSRARETYFVLKLPVAISHSHRLIVLWPFRLVARKENVNVNANATDISTDRPKKLVIISHFLLVLSDFFGAVIFLLLLLLRSLFSVEFL